MTTPIPQEYEYVFIIQQAVSILSFVGPLFILLTYVLIPSIRSFSMKLVISLCAADLFYNISSILNFWFNESPLICTISGYIREIGCVSSVLWAFFISFVAHSALTRRADYSKYYTYFIILNILVCMPIPTISLVLQLLNDEPQYGIVTTWCGLTSSYIWGIYILAWSLVALTIMYNVKILRLIAQMQNDLLANFQVKSMMIYPTILVLAWIPAMLTRVMILKWGSVPIWVVYVQTVFFFSQGFLNAIFYGRSHFNKIIGIFKAKSRRNSLVETLV